MWIKGVIRKGLNGLLGPLGYRIAPKNPQSRYVRLAGNVWTICKPFTLTNAERLYALAEAVRYVQRAGVEGDIVECGVWRGGSMMCAAITLLELGDSQRRLYLYDTFSGMVQPASMDVRHDGTPAATLWREGWDSAGVDEVVANLATTGYPMDRISLVAGKVEDTIPGTMPERIAILRLDTDFYESTYHEMCHLYPRLAPGGILLVDDYDHWQGSRNAVDQYLSEQGIPLMLSPLAGGRLAVKST